MGEFYSFFIFCAIILLTQANRAPVCDWSECTIDKNCRCSTNVNPIKDNQSPQFIVLDFDEAVVDNLYRDYWVPLLYDRVNPDGNPIRATFFVPHEYTDYERVNQLYLHGFEIGVNSISKNPLQSYWRNATLEQLIEEFDGQRTIISHFANIPIQDINGARTPQLQIEGDTSIAAYKASGLSFDNSWATISTDPYFPYTLDYRSSQKCDISMKCPEESHPGFWIFPLQNIKGANNIECNSMVACRVNGTVAEISNWLLNEVNKVRNGSRTPLNFRIDSYWFKFYKNSYDGLVMFLDKLKEFDDVYLVAQSDVLEWIKNPVPLSEYHTNIIQRSAECDSRICSLLKFDGSVRYMKTCVRCPYNYPWLGNPYGK